MDYLLRRAKRKFEQTGDIEAAARYIFLLEKTVNDVTPYEIQKTLVLSTSHVSPFTREWLEENSYVAGTPVWLNYEHGWILYVDKEEDLAIPQDLLNLLQLAGSLQCSWLRLDQDGDVYEDLPVYG